MPEKSIIQEPQGVEGNAKFTPVTFTTFKIIVAKASSIIPEGRNDPLDISDYYSVKE